VKRFCWILFLLVAGLSASAVEVQQVRWGFDGMVVPGRFNLFSVLLVNPSDQPFDGTVRLYKYRGTQNRVGAVYESACYLSPQTIRWLQFYVYIATPYDQWRLECGRGVVQEIDAPKWGPPAQVLLSDVPTMSSNFRLFPEELFPPTEVATSGLDALLIDHVPHWEPAKRQAFLDWLHAGGKVHLLIGADGRYPVFSDELSVLNTSVERVRAGAGLIVKHTTTAREIRRQDMDDNEIPARQFKPSDAMEQMQAPDLLFGNLAQLGRRHYSWTWIYFLAALYLAVVGPANLRAARKLMDYRLRIVVLVATIAGFTFLFNLVGRRGQAERSVIHSLSYARAIDSNTYDVMQWVNVFAISGSRYTITHAAPHNLYDTGKDYETVNGVIQSGKAGKFVVDIPMYSRRTFLHEAKMVGPAIPLKIVQWDGDKALEQLVVTVDADFSSQLLDGWAIDRYDIYTMVLTNQTLVFRNLTGQSVESFLAKSALEPFGNPQVQVPQENGPTDEGVFRKLAKPLIAWSLGAKDFSRINEPARMEDGRIQLFLFARSPASFGITETKLGAETGYVLYHLDLFKPGAEYERLKPAGH
jgi:hypothetical protein